MSSQLRELNIDGKIINDDSEAYVIAEIGHNHQGDVELCERFFQAAVKAGASAVKLQKRNNKSLYTNEFFNSPYAGPTSFGNTYGEHREFLEFDKKQYLHLQSVAKDLGITFFATAFDLSSADFLMELGIPAFKIASGDLRSAPLIKHLAESGLPLILSTGGATMLEIERAMDDVNPANVGLLQCTAAYPAEAEDMNLKVIETFRSRFPSTVVGLSAHDRGIAFPILAYALGGRIIEKHFTLDRAMKGTDHAFSLEPAGFEKMVRDLKHTKQALGSATKGPLEKEKAPIKKMGKMLVYGRSLKTGEVIDEGCLEMKSPQIGLSPQAIDVILGKTLKQGVSLGEIVELEHFSF